MTKAKAKEDTNGNGASHGGVVLAQTAGPPADLLEDIAQYVGRGVSTSQADNQTPLIYILQPLSPQVNPRNPDHIDGAEPGAIWLRNAVDPIVPGDQGIEFQPCYFWKDWVEWVPRDDGGGFVGRHPNKEVGAEDVPDVKGVVCKVNDKNGQKEYFMPNGNELRLTRNHAGRVRRPGRMPEPFILPLTGSGHSVSRNWMGKMNAQRVPNLPNALPSFARWYKITTRYRKNPQGEWYQPEIAEGPWSTRDEMREGNAIFEAFQSGERTAEAPAEVQDNPADVSGGGAI